MPLKKMKFAFFKLVGQQQIIFKNTFWISLAEVSARILKFFLIIFVIRILGAKEYGKFSFAFSFVTLLTVFFDFGLSLILTREFAKDKKNEKYFLSILSLKIFLEIFAMILIAIGSFFITQDWVIRKIILILALYVLCAEQCNFFYAFFRARQKMEYEAWLKIFQAIILTTVGFGIILKSPSIIRLSLAYPLSTFISLIIILYFFYSRISPLKISFNIYIWKRFLSMSWPLALIGAMSTVYNYTDSVMMGYYGQITQTGHYNASYKIISMALLPMNLLTISFYPALSKALNEKKYLQKIWNFLTGIMIFLAMPLLIGGYILAHKIIIFLYGPEYLPSVLAFKILLFSAFIIYLYNSYNQILIVSNQQKKLFFSISIGAIINVVLNLILIPKYSLYGAAVATVVTHSIVFIQLFSLTSKYTFIKIFNFSLFKTIFSALIAGLTMYIFLFYSNFGLSLNILSGIIIYLFSFYITKILLFNRFLKNSNLS